MKRNVDLVKFNTQFNILQSLIREANWQMIRWINWPHKTVSGFIHRGILNTNIWKVFNIAVTLSLTLFSYVLHFGLVSGHIQWSASFKAHYSSFRGQINEHVAYQGILGLSPIPILARTSRFSVLSSIKQYNNQKSEKNKTMKSNSQNRFHCMI